MVCKVIISPCINMKIKPSRCKIESDVKSIWTDMYIAAIVG